LIPVITIEYNKPPSSFLELPPPKKKTQKTDFLFRLQLEQHSKAQTEDLLARGDTRNEWSIVP